LIGSTSTLNLFRHRDSAIRFRNLFCPSVISQIAAEKSIDGA
jgi:hypothetical protein